MAKIEIGVLVPLVESPEEEMRKVADLGLRSCQVCAWDPALYTPGVGQALVDAAKRHQVTITTLWSGYPGRMVWNFLEGPSTIGLVPPATRALRVEALQKAARFAASIPLASITTHVGFIPSDPNDPLFAGTLEAIRQVLDVCLAGGIEFWFETGQETPVTLLRTIQRLGGKGLGINLDTANLILYGNGNPVDALDVFGRYVRGTHAKDGRFPTNGDSLGSEVPIGQGKVDWPTVIAKLKALGYRGALTIEREISGPQQIKDIQAAIEYLGKLV